MTPMLVDEIDIKIIAGHGGAGKFAPIKGFKTTPGDGGRGGSVYVSTTSDLSALNKFTGIRQIKAGDGERGGDNGRAGKSGTDIDILLPMGTSIVNTETNDVLEFDNLVEHVLLCKGGRGGRGGNMRAQPGLPGQTIQAKLVLKLISKYGFVGLPNAGKSSLLNALTNTKAEIGAYPFTTLEPNLGVLNGQIIADIPGLIEGASEGRGLGIKFLKHIEKVSLLFHCIACNTAGVVKDYQTINTELENFGAGLLEKPQIIVLTKTDLVTPEIIKSHLKALKKFKHGIISVSIHDPASLEEFKKVIL